MTYRKPLYLHEEIMLLALRDEEGTTEFGTMYQYAIGGAVLAELLLRGRIGVDESKKKKKLVQLLDPKLVGEPILDECIEKIRTAKRRGSLQTWVSRFAGIKKLGHRVAEGLCRQGILRADEDKVLMIFTRKIYPEIDPAPEREMIDRLREAIFTDKTEIEPRTVVLASLAKSAQLLKIPFDKKELKARKDRIEKIINGEVTGKATREAVQAVQAAIMVTCILPAIVTTTITVASGCTPSDAGGRPSRRIPTMPNPKMTAVWIRPVTRLGSILPASRAALLIGAANRRRNDPTFFSS